MKINLVKKQVTGNITIYISLAYIINQTWEIYKKYMVHISYILKNFIESIWSIDDWFVLTKHDNITKFSFWRDTKYINYLLLARIYRIFIISHYNYSTSLLMQLFLLMYIKHININKISAIMQMFVLVQSFHRRYSINISYTRVYPV